MNEAICNPASLVLMLLLGRCCLSGDFVPITEVSVCSPHLGPFVPFSAPPGLGGPNGPCSWSFHWSGLAGHDTVSEGPPLPSDIGHWANSTSKARDHRWALQTSKHSPQPRKPRPPSTPLGPRPLYWLTPLYPIPNPHRRPHWLFLAPRPPARRPYATLWNIYCTLCLEHFSSFSLRTADPSRIFFSQCYISTVGDRANFEIKQFYKANISTPTSPLLTFKFPSWGNHFNLWIHVFLYLLLYFWALYF